MVLAICALIHLAGMIWAVRGGLSAAEILGRTQGNWGFASFYALFVLACAIHVPIGLHNVLTEWTALSEQTSLRLSRLFGLFLLFFGLRAVFAVVAP